MCRCLLLSFTFESIDCLYISIYLLHFLYIICLKLYLIILIAISVAIVTVIAPI
ncbi:hypothetical protein J3Q64DRAFT_1737353 [Phycomyces blakesleeanus]|uniref:Uncharacterized protein n=1 Tax=Phycomyces blakesleeanus TaxID=4837 RepID=A0ABR3B102_PHYBL